MTKRPADDPGPSLFATERPGAWLAGRRRRALFIPAALSEAARKKSHLYAAGLAAAQPILEKWADLETNGALQRKETSLNADFLLEVFGRALGYRPVTGGLPEHQLEREFTVPDVGTADGALGNFSGEVQRPPVAVIELKDADTHLDLDRSAGRTAVQQCWDYLNALPDCPWGIVSNFVTLRLYHRDHGSRVYEQFTLQELRSPERLREFFHLLGPGGLLPTKLEPVPRAEQLLRLTVDRQREVGDELYEEYSRNRLALIDHLHTRQGRPLDQAIAIAQKLLDRIVFVAFCEDRGLLPDKIIERTYREIPPLAQVTNPRWRNFLDLFRAIDQGHKILNLNGGFDGGLFEHRPDVDELQLDDDWTDFFHGISRYDFCDEVNVDVLGHLFEKSVTELEKLRAGGLFGSGAEKPGVAPAMPKSAERKRFGIYYTPPELTDFIVQCTVGDVIRERFAEVATVAGLPPDRPHEGTAEQTAAYWQGCLEALRRVRVCDPACGSGAFLIRAYDFLEAQYAEIIDGLARHDERQAAALADAVPGAILKDNLFGVDVSPEAVEITQLALWIRTARRGQTLADLSRNIIRGNSLVDDPAVDPEAMTWADKFPAVFDGGRGGFDCVIGNPPWERLKLQEREFFALAAPEIAGAVSAAERRKLVAKLECCGAQLHERYRRAKEKADRVLGYARACGRYPLAGKGDINTYMLFAELARSIVAPRGRVGLLTPSGIASDKTTRTFFNELIDAQSLVRLYDFENRRGIFRDVHRSFKFCTLILGGAETRTPSPDFVFFAHGMEDLAERKRHIALSAEDMALVNPNTRTCPVFRSRRDAELTKGIYRRVPILVDRTRREGGNPWGIRFVRMFDQTNDAELFHTREQLREMGFRLDGNRWKLRKRVFLPLYEAKMVQAYDHRAAGVVVEPDKWVRQGQTKPTSLVSHQNPEFVVQPRWWVDEAEVSEALPGDPRPAYLCYKDVTSPTNERTMIAAFIPHVGVVNSAPLVLCGHHVDVRLQCCLLANLNSFVLDFVARQKVGNVHLNFFLVEQFPMLPPDAYDDRCPWEKRQTLKRWVSDRVLKLTCTADDMRPLAEAAGFAKGVHKWKLDDRARLLAELDAAYFHLYGLRRDDAEYILSTFTGTQRRDVSDVGDYRTAQLILEAFERSSA